MRKPFLVILFFIIAGSITAQQFNPGDALSRMNNAIGASQEEFTMQDSYFLGRTVAAHILSQYKLYTEKPAVIEYLNLICASLAINSPVPNWYSGYHVMVLDIDVPCAFSTPGGHIFISRGLLDITVSEDMLAAIIAHEMSHIQLQHSIADIKNIRVSQGLTREQARISQEVSTEKQHEFTQSINQIVQSLLGRGFSQLQEFDADANAIAILASTGYSPKSLIDLLKILDRLTGPRFSSLNNSHPLPVQRIANAERRMPTHWIPDSDPAREARFKRIMGR
ncbi:MAG: M48 family metalloprotease [Treponema sp.]|nr:M48 family metalloprotease [Treponema sp.]